MIRARLTSTIVPHGFFVTMMMMVMIMMMMVRMLLRNVTLSMVMS